MSCQQVSRLITSNNSSNISNINNIIQTSSNFKNLSNNSHSQNILKGNNITKGVAQQEDPYVFTESVPTTPPILYNTQKTRTRLNDLTSTSVGKSHQQKLPLTEANGKITSNSSQIKTQASFLSLTAIPTTNTSDVATIKNKGIQSLTSTKTATTITKANSNCNNNNSKKLTNVCIVRPQLQIQPSSYYHQQHFGNSSNVYEEDLKSISPPPLYAPPTPSLWQTPLLLETTTPTSAKVVNVEVPKTPTTATSVNMPIMACVTPTVQTVGSTITTINPSLTTTAMAKVAPIIVHTQLAPSSSPLPAQSPNQCLPPSKFHNHTLAQHLQKVECLKKAKKSTEDETIHCKDNDNSIASPLPPSSATCLKGVNKTTSPDDHSESEDLNEIPVNVIFRMAVAPQANEKSSNNTQYVIPQPDTQPPLPTQPSEAPPAPLLTTTQTTTNVEMKLSIPASKTIVTKQLAKSQEINTSSKPQQQQQQQHNAIKTTKTTTLKSQQQLTPNDDDDEVSQIPPGNSETSNEIFTNGSTTIVTNLKKKSSAHISSKTRKLNSICSTNFNSNLAYNWQMGCSTTKGAVAIVKMSQHNTDMDTNHLATASGLPYCLQQYWLHLHDCSEPFNDLLFKDNSPINRSLAREKRIAEYKQQLRRQAMQFFSTKSLQKLPLKIAKRRLMCVDRLLRKYKQNEQNMKEPPANVKRCCINGCDAHTLEMASQCQQHIVYNAVQHVFLPCTAKFADNTQCRVPVFDITHDLPLCMEHARKRDAYNRLLYEQRPRKISTNPLVMNDSIILTSKQSATNKIAGLADGGVSLKAQNYQHKQHQNILQQLPLNNNSNGNKRSASVNQQARKRKMTVGATANPVGRPQKRVKKTVDKSATITNKNQMPRLTLTSLKRKNSTTSLESIASNSQHSTTSCTSQQQSQQCQRQQLHQHLYGVTPTMINNSKPSLAPPALAPLSTGVVGHGLPQHLFSFSHDNHHHQRQQPLHPINISEKHSFSDSTTSTATASTPTELKDFISQFSFNSQKRTIPAETTSADVNLLNTNSNSNFTSSGMGSTTSLPTADDFLTQDMLSICENSSSSSADTGLGGLSDPELMLGGPEDDIPLGDTHLLEEHDLENVLNSLPEDAFKELFATVHQDESDEIERAIELADKHLKTLQQTIGSELGDFLDFSDDMLMGNGDLCNGSTANTILNTSASFAEGGGTVDSTSIAVATNATQTGGAVIANDIRGLVQT